MEYTCPFECALSGETIQSLPGYGLLVCGAYHFISRTTCDALITLGRAAGLMRYTLRAPHAVAIVRFIEDDPPPTYYAMIVLRGLDNDPAWGEAIRGILSNRMAPRPS